LKYGNKLNYPITRKELFLSTIRKLLKATPKLILLDEDAYDEYGLFLTKNFIYVSRGLHIPYHGNKIYFVDILEYDINFAKNILWEKFVTRNSKVYMLIKREKPLGFAVMEPEGILSYLFVDEKYAY